MSSPTVARVHVDKVAIGTLWDFTKGDKMTLVQGKEPQVYHIPDVRSETMFTFDTECPLCPGFGEGICREQRL